MANYFFLRSLFEIQRKFLINEIGRVIAWLVQDANFFLRNSFYVIVV